MVRVFLHTVNVVLSELKGVERVPDLGFGEGLAHCFELIVRCPRVRV